MSIFVHYVAKPRQQTRQRSFGFTVAAFVVRGVYDFDESE